MRKVVPLVLWLAAVLAVSAAERPLVEVLASTLPSGPLEGRGRGVELPLREPTLVRHGNGPGIFVVERDHRERQINFEKQVGGEEVAMQFEWPRSGTEPRKLTIHLRLQIKVVSKGGSMNIVFRSADGKRVVPRFQVTNGGSLSLVTSPEEVFQFEKALPVGRFADLSMVIDYQEKTFQLSMDGSAISAPVPIAPSQSVTHISFSSSEGERARWSAFEKIVITEDR